MQNFNNNKTIDGLFTVYTTFFDFHTSDFVGKLYQDVNLKKYIKIRFKLKKLFELLQGTF